MRSSDTQPAPEFDRLVDALIDGDLVAEDAARLESLLLSSRRARDDYRRRLRIEAMLECGLVGEEQGGPGPTRQDVPTRWRLAGSVLAALITSAVGAAVAAVVLLMGGREPMESGGSPAVLTAATDAVFVHHGSGEAVPHRVGDPIAAGPMRLESGALQLTFAKGAVVGVNAPADLEIVNDSRLFLRSGRIVPLVPPRAKGFTVVAPSGEIVDLGTEFSVSVDRNGKADVHVLDGEVTVANGHGVPVMPRHLTTGYSASMSATAMKDAAQITAVPLFMDSFQAGDGMDLSADIAMRQSGLAAPIGYRSLEEETPGRLRNGGLEIPFVLPPNRPKPVTRVVLDHDFNEVRGRRWSIAFKAWLPREGVLPEHHFVACVVGAGEGPGDMPLAMDKDAALAMMISPLWQTVVDFSGPYDPPPQPSMAVFPRSQPSAGAYQVFIHVDETGEGDAIIDVTVNGRCLLRNFHFPIDRDRPRLIGFQTWTKSGTKSVAYARIDDVCVSVEREDAATRATDEHDADRGT